jgi:hypothetical protein
VNRHARTALANHCRLSIETMRPEFGWRVGGRTYVLTVNSGYE